MGFLSSGAHLKTYYTPRLQRIVSEYIVNRSYDLNGRSALTMLEEWAQATGIARAYKIGKGEADAVSSLMTAISPHIVERLEDAVKKRGLQKFLLHEVLSKGIFHSSWTSGTGECEAWKDELRNRDDCVLVFCHQHGGVT